MVGARVMAWVLAAIAVIALIGLVVIASKPDAQRHQEQHQAKPAEQDAAAKPSGNESTQEQSECRAEDQEKHNYWERFVCYVETRDKFFTAFGTIIIAAFTVCLVIATVSLYVATKNLVESADDTSQRQLRAYIGLHGGETTIYPFEQGGFAFIAHVEFRNYGQTPAHDLTTKCNVKIDVPENVPFDDFPGVERGTPTVAFKDVSFHVRMGWPISEADKVALFERRKVFFVWGIVEYKDVFDKPHRFKFHMMSAELATGVGGVYNMNPHKPGFEGD
jgi:hypothetical protein